MNAGKFNAVPASQFSITMSFVGRQIGRSNHGDARTADDRALRRTSVARHAKFAQMAVRSVSQSAGFAGESSTSPPLLRGGMNHHRAVSFRIRNADD